MYINKKSLVVSPMRKERERIEWDLFIGFILFTFLAFYIVQGIAYIIVRWISN
jgi:hypothetical protein